MFLRSNKRIKDGKEHRYYTVVESRRLRSGKVAQRQVLYLGEINDSQQSSWRKTLEVFDEEQPRFTPLSLFPEDRPVPADAVGSVQVKLSEMKLERARPYGNCWLGCELWRQLQLDRFWSEKLPGAGKRRLASGARAVGGEPADRSWQRVPCAPAVVRSERDGRFAGAGFWSGGKRSVVPVSGSGAGSQARSVLAFTATLERSVRCGVRCAAV